MENSKKLVGKYKSTDFKMKKKTYQKPTTEIIDVVLSQLIAASPGWSQDGNDPINVGKEEEHDNDSTFLDLD